MQLLRKKIKCKIMDLEFWVDKFSSCQNRIWTPKSNKTPSKTLVQITSPENFMFRTLSTNSHEFMQRVSNDS